MRSDLAAIVKAAPLSQATLIRALSRESDVGISTLYEKVYAEAKARPLRRQQQRLGALIHRVNLKLKPLGMRIQPGFARRTYRLYVARG